MWKTLLYFPGVILTITATDISCILEENAVKAYVDCVVDHTIGPVAQKRNEYVNSTKFEQWT